ncbi:Putative uncharacterized transposon-derived protein F52C9.6 [Eumeta japonica]|uniref:Uncharacterized transposon-derived protein F52C9.6 n=1 Tax=Eumeta variegata TaxID=151549 RepID=A0A4C1VWA5_EUMVA|nr:Putative uncharacterized transposon-derived protein F52C9.6 [Eumeta japonica]
MPNEINYDIMGISEVRRQDNKIEEHSTFLLCYIEPFALKRKWQWTGHVARMPDKRWTTRVTQWKGPPGKRRRGRPLTHWEEDLKRSAGSDWYSTAQDRQKWTSLEEAFT